MWTTLGSLALVLLLILAAGRLWKQHSPAARMPVAPEAVEPLGQRSLDQRHTIHLVRLGARILVLGSSAEGLQMLCEITDPAEVDGLVRLCRRSEADQHRGAWFRPLLRKGSADASHRPTPAEKFPAKPSGFDGRDSMEGLFPDVSSQAFRAETMESPDRRPEVSQYA